jgi:hypothetical protein
MAAVIMVEHERLWPSAIARALGQWDKLARNGALFRPGSEQSGVPECCGLGPCGILAGAIRYLSHPAKACLA